MIHCKELNKDFENQADLFKELKANKKTIIDVKKAEILESRNNGLAIDVDKTRILLGDTIKGLEIDDSYYYIVVNSSRILDSHDDMHADGLWDESAKQRQGKNYLCFNHDLDPAQVIVRKEHIEMITAIVPFSSLGKDYEGDTYVLIYKFKKDKVTNPIAKEWLESGDEIQASVRMQYVNIVLAMNSQDNDDKSELLNYNNYYPLIANKEDFEEIRYFWVVKEAKNVLESSLVTFASNPITGQIEQKHTEPSQDTQKEEPSLDTQKAIDRFKELTSKI